MLFALTVKFFYLLRVLFVQYPVLLFRSVLLLVEWQWVIGAGVIN